MCTETLFIRTRKQKLSTYPGTDEWINKMWDSRRMEYYLTLKRNELPIHAKHESTLKTY